MANTPPHHLTYIFNPTANRVKHYFHVSYYGTPCIFSSRNRPITPKSFFNPSSSSSSKIMLVFVFNLTPLYIFRNVKFYTCCDEPYLDITFNITMRRKTLFYTGRLSSNCKMKKYINYLNMREPRNQREFGEFLTLYRIIQLLWRSNLVDGYFFLQQFCIDIL